MNQPRLRRLRPGSRARGARRRGGGTASSTPLRHDELRHAWRARRQGSRRHRVWVRRSGVADEERVRLVAAGATGDPSSSNTSHALALLAEPIDENAGLGYRQGVQAGHRRSSDLEAARRIRRMACSCRSGKGDLTTNESVCRITSGCRFRALTHERHADALGTLQSRARTPGTGRRCAPPRLVDGEEEGRSRRCRADVGRARPSGPFKERLEIRGHIGHPLAQLALLHRSG